MRHRQRRIQTNTSNPSKLFALVKRSNVTFRDSSHLRYCIAYTVVLIFVNNEGIWLPSKEWGIFDSRCSVHLIVLQEFIHGISLNISST